MSYDTLKTTKNKANIFLENGGEKMFWILVIGIVIVYCVLKGEDNSGNSSGKRSSTTTSKTQAAKTLDVPYPYSTIKKIEIPVYFRETGINGKPTFDIWEKKITYVNGHHMLTLCSSFGFENRNNFEMHWENAVFYDANGRMVDVQHKGCRGIVPKYDEFGEHPETIVEYELD